MSQKSTLVLCHIDYSELFLTRKLNFFVKPGEICDSKMIILFPRPLNFSLTVFYEGQSLKFLLFVFQILKRSVDKNQNFTYQIYTVYECQSL